MTRFICPLCVPLSLAVEWPLDGTRQAFCPWRGNTTSSRCTLGRRAFSPSRTQGIPIPWHFVQTLLHHCLSCSLPLSLTSLHKKGSLLSLALQLFCPPIYIPKPCICHVLSLQLCRLLSSSSVWFPSCSKWFDGDLTVFEGWGKLRVHLLFHHLNSSSMFTNF